MGIRFSFDIGTNSIGWAVWRVGPDPRGIFGPDAPLELLGSGVRIFKDGRNPKDGASLAEMRRVPRSARRRRDRFVLRREDLIGALVETGLMPEDQNTRKALQALDPYELRGKGLNDKLDLHAFGRAIFHLNQRRGFQSNSKVDKKDSDKGKIADASKRLAEQLEAEKCRTFGEFLWLRHRGRSGDPRKVRDPERQPVRIRLDGVGAKALYEFYPTRDMLRHEFDLLWQAQAKHHPAVLTDAAREKIETILFRQRPLKRPKVGYCTFVEGETRLPKALPSVLEREMYERINHLRFIDASGRERGLRPEERDVLASFLRQEDKLTFTKLRKALKLGGDIRINYEESGEKDLRGIVVNKIMAKPDHYGPAWAKLPLAAKDAFITKIIEEMDDDALMGWLTGEHNLSHEHAHNCMTAPLPDGYSRLGPTANGAILDALHNEVSEKGEAITFSQAVASAGWHHSDERDGEIWSKLPYYGVVLQRHILPGTMAPEDKKDDAAYWGRITNPTVHIGLNQLRRIVNRMIEVYGHPDQIVVELARELKQSQKQKDEEQKRNRSNRDANDQRRKKLGELGAEPNGATMSKLKLFEEQMVGGVVLCPFSGKAIGIEKLYSPEIEIEHLLPWSRSLDDSMGNKVLCYREWNRRKRGKTPYEAFGDSPEWSDILARASSYRKERFWRFLPDAMDKFQERGDFLQRQLNETKYLSRIAKGYLGRICDPDQIYVTPGRLTALMRGKWGLNDILSDHNRKNRFDHRHHAVDAIVIGTMTRSLIQHVAREAGKLEEGDSYQNAIGKFIWPFDGFRQAIRDVVESIIVSHKPEHGKKGALHEDTAYGLVRDEGEAKEIGNLVRRKPIADLTPGEVDRIRDPHLRKQVQELVGPLRDAKGAVKDTTAFSAMLTEFGMQWGDKGMRRVRVGKLDTSVVGIRQRKGNGDVYKTVAPGANHHMDIVQMRDGSWQGFAASVYEVNQDGWRPDWEAKKLGGKLVMRVHKGDLIELMDDDGVWRVKQVIQIRPSTNRMYLAPSQEGGELQKRHDDENDSFRWDMATISKLKDRNAILRRLNELGI